ncbi:MAG: hypothetical protein K2Q34_01785 [Alphaproteobacteria bacterium]|nr:hypothetical protein [Alphaproteobacteria bacterium]
MNFSNLSKFILAIGLFVLLNSNVSNASVMQDVSHLPTCPSVCNSKDQASCAGTKVRCKTTQFDAAESNCVWGPSKSAKKDRCKSMNSATYVCNGRCSTMKEKYGCKGQEISCNENDDKELRDVNCNEKKGIMGTSCVPALKS